MKSKHIIAGSTGVIQQQGMMELGPVIQYGLKITGKSAPKICYLGTAAGDAAEWTTSYYTACMGNHVFPSHVNVFPMPNVRDVRKHVLEQDMIWVGGGSVANLLAVWRVHGLDEILREAWENGIVLGGRSAGSICWHTGGTTDSFGVDLRPVTNGLGFLPYSNGVHYDSEERRRPLFQQLIAEGTLGEGYATDDGVALHYRGRKLHKVIADTPNKYAYHVMKTDGGVQETRLEAELLSD
jgi:peptidase E